MNYKRKLAARASLVKQKQQQAYAQAVTRAEELRYQINIVDLIGQDTALSNCGNGEYRGLCPLHDDHEPSFYVNEEKQVYNCFYCGGGDIVKYLRERDGVNFFQALAVLDDFIAGDYVPKHVERAEPENTTAVSPPDFSGNGLYGQYAPKLIEFGYWPVPLYPSKKNPYGNGWNKHDEPLDPVRYSGCDVGILCGVGDYPVYAIDIDVRDKTVTYDIIMYIKKLLDTPNIFVRVGMKPKALIPVRMRSQGMPKRLSTKFDCGQVEILGYGQQFKCFGIHPDTGEPYKWASPNKDTSFLATPPRELPIVTNEQIDLIIEHFEANHQVAQNAA